MTQQIRFTPPRRLDEYGNEIRTACVGPRRWVTIVTAPDGGIIRMSYSNAVFGEIPMHLDGRLARKIAKALRCAGATKGLS